MSSWKARNAADCRRRIHILPRQVIQDLHVQWPLLALVGFVQKICNLHRHCIWHSTRLRSILAVIALRLGLYKLPFAQMFARKTAVSASLLDSRGL